jgi:hypothetical protein
MPLIRYRTADFGRLCNGVIERMNGRDLEYVVTRSGERIPGAGPALRVDRTRSDLAHVLASLCEPWQGFFDMSLAIVEQIPKTKAGKVRLVVREPDIQEFPT